tara:strand:- start:2869 stop:3087 length:219 start_codon:yes stop_codon:yes gene_type:complete
MTKVTIDEVEYETEDFSEDQKALINELQYNSTVQTQLNYELSSVRTVGNILANRLKASLNPDEEVDDNEEAA